ncbi:hypothetical protein BFW38_15320 [Terasakiispira papahanaumokuakeensis]|uniref:Thioredoxin domain-containing protein n=1 Tax=Terasakiispira papahanaumokuakeensis TaxID=197479 RepID=A0A1E2VEW2_9GAMM|nr:hypothetical protein BFW38_15320 [Terasakiispira papahanaumokuakeensis]
MNRTLLLCGFIALLILLSVQICRALWWHHDDETPPSGGRFTLQSAQGPISTADFPDHLLVIFFGYTHCPDICPTAMTVVSTAMHKLNPQQRAHVQPIFITLDPERDTTQRLKQYTDFFESHIIGVTGTQAQIDAVAQRFGAFYRKIKLDSALGYSIDHSAQLYLTNSQGQILNIVHHSNRAESLLKAIQDTLPQLTAGTPQQQAGS